MTLMKSGASSELSVSREPESACMRTSPVHEVGVNARYEKGHPTAGNPTSSPLGAASPRAQPAGAAGEGSCQPPPTALPCAQGVLLINLGTPDSPDTAAVRRYLSEFLSDPEVIRLPRGFRWLNRPLGWLIAQLRAPKSAAMYRRIWSERGSPLDSITAEQALLLGDALGGRWRVYYAMRYGRPSIASTLDEIAKSGVTDLVVLPMYPHFSGTTTRTALRVLYRCLERRGYHINVTTRNVWYDDAGYIHAQAKVVERYARLHGLTPLNTHLVFSAHGLPVSYVEQGDPYPDHIRRTVELVAARLSWPSERMSVAYQSRLGPVEWLKPSTSARVDELIRDGEKRVLVCPISFTADCLETLEEIDIRCRAQVEKAGAELYLCPALNTDRAFISALASIVQRGVRATSSWSGGARPLIPRPAALDAVHADYASLVMVGVSLPKRVGGGYGPQQVHASEPSLQKIKKTQAEMSEILRKICATGSVREAMVWNTCSRFEFYGFPAEQEDTAEGECIVRRVREHLFNRCEQEDVPVNILCGWDAWQHLIRTTAGLNSGLPGDADVAEQLQTAYRIARRAGTAGPLLDRLVADAIAHERELRKATRWGEFNPGYCLAAISRIVETSTLNLPDSRCVIIGGSTTSRSVLTTLIERFEVPSRFLTLVYRGHTGGQIKQLRKAIGNGRRVRVQTYGERQVRQAIADADVVFFGIDRAEPVLHADDIRDARDFTSRPLTVIDFNTFGSTKGLETIPGVTLIDAKKVDDAVNAFADAMCATEAFVLAVREAEDLIRERRPEIRAEPAGLGWCHESKGGDGNSPLLDTEVNAAQRWRQCLRCSRKRSASACVTLAEVV
ncbi:MAG: ferrochelatase [Phycisphaerae bacterium]